MDIIIIIFILCCCCCIILLGGGYFYVTNSSNEVITKTNEALTKSDKAPTKSDKALTTTLPTTTIPVPKYLEITMPANKIMYNNVELQYFNDPKFPYMNSKLEGLNKYISKCWSFGNFKNRTFAPVTTVLTNYDDKEPFLYENKWESSWWLNGQSNDYLVIELDKPRLISQIDARNFQSNANIDAGILEIYNILSFSNNTISQVDLIGSIALTKGTLELGKLKIDKLYKNLLFSRKDVTGWSKLDNITLYGDKN
jgi:hypothetical protein